MVIGVGVGVGAEQSNVHGVIHKRCLPPAAPVPIPDLRSGLHTPPPHLQPFTGEIILFYSFLALAFIYHTFDSPLFFF